MEIKQKKAGTIEIRKVYNSEGCYGPEGYCAKILDQGESFVVVENENIPAVCAALLGCDRIWTERDGIKMLVDLCPEMSKHFRDNDPRFAELVFEFEWEGERHRMIDKGDSFILKRYVSELKQWYRVSFEDRPKAFYACCLDYMRARLKYHPNNSEEVK